MKARETFSGVRVLNKTVDILDALGAHPLGLTSPTVKGRARRGVCSSADNRRLDLNACDRFLWPGSLTFGLDWCSALVIVKPETVLAWHRKGFRLFWTWNVQRGETRNMEVSSCHSRSDKDTVDVATTI